MALKEKDPNSQRLTVTSESTEKPIKRRPSLKSKKPAGNDDKRRRLSEGASEENHEETGKKLQTFSTNLLPSVGLPTIAQSQSMNIQSSVQPTPAMQCYGCHMNIYQGPVDHSEPKKE